MGEGHLYESPPTCPRKKGRPWLWRDESLEVRTVGLLLLSHQGLPA